MGKSRKNNSRGRIKRRRHLRNQRDRQAGREKKKYARETFILSSFLKNRKWEIFFLLVMLIVIMLIVALGPDKRAIKKMSDSVSSLIADQSASWKEAYPYGYKIIALTEREIIHTSFDTLPEALEIHWKNLSVARIQADQLKNTDEKIKIEMPDINYAPANISRRTVTASFTRKKGMVTSLARWGKMEFAVEIIEDDGERLFCLFGLRSK